ncbi:Acetyltransferase, GNAT family protein [Sulfitobacter noctilucicola]|uniref:ElaA protein n=1 Tax=Sulfitobacter noctilucicola TaxID=1342301 RepID=A0A7W6Q4A1_9RHOB|nr:GNAT family N-acetyltransferase [Sulfitobacter noctilucicola]KIN62993.1 Acetyltransferase, GNAT family protein [Sulfitobacter noctilucicola]MBB4172480.1 ElaA protein [Sulfitobacter noctilucicola]
MTAEIALTDDIATCHALRRAVFIEEQGVSEADELDELDDIALHLLAMAEAEPVGTARIVIADGVAKIGRVCVVKAHRGTGLGAALVRMAMDVSRGKAAKAKLGAQVQAIAFYEALGFTAFGPVYDDAGIDHRDMVCDL